MHPYSLFHASCSAINSQLFAAFPQFTELILQAGVNNAQVVLEQEYKLLLSSYFKLVYFKRLLVGTIA